MGLGTMLPLNGLPANAVLDVHEAVVHENTLKKSYPDSVRKLEKVKTILFACEGAIIHTQFVYGEYGLVPDDIEAESAVNVTNVAQEEARKPTFTSILPFCHSNSVPWIAIDIDIANMSIGCRFCMSNSRV